MRNEESPDNARVPVLRALPGVSHDDETKARAFVLFATTAARNYAATERLMAEERKGSGLPVPTERAIAHWAQDDHWADQADDVWRNTKEWTHEQLQVIALANVLLGQQRRHEILQGKLEDKDMLAAQYLKAGELSDKFVEKVLPIKSMRPPEKERAGDDEMSKEEREALARTRIVRKKEESA